MPAQITFKNCLDYNFSFENQNNEFLNLELDPEQEAMSWVPGNDFKISNNDYDSILSAK